MRMPHPQNKAQKKGAARHSIMERAACPYCGNAIALDSIESHITSHETVQLFFNGRRTKTLSFISLTSQYMTYALNFTHSKEGNLLIHSQTFHNISLCYLMFFYLSPDRRSIFSSHKSDEEYVKQLVAQEEQALNESVALGLVQHDVTNREKYESKSPLSSVITSPEQLAHALRQTELKDGQKGPTAREFDAQFLAYVDRTHRKGTEKEVTEISHVVLFDIDNCGGEFEQIADAFIQYPKLLVYVVGGPALPNVANVKLPIFAEMHQSKRLHIIPMTKKGKNAADFVLSFYGGVLHERLPLQIPFVVVSKDKGLNQLVEHLGLLGRAGKLISTDIVKHLSFGQNPVTNTTTNTTTTTTTAATTTTQTKDPNNNNTDTTPNTAPYTAPNTAPTDTFNAPLQWATGNPFEANATEYTLEQAIWFVVSGISKTEAAQRPKTRQKLDNVVGAFLKRIPGKKDNISLQAVIEGMQTQNFIFLDGSKVVYLF